MTPHDQTPPDWNLIHFDVTCPRCGHDLHGRSEPTCPNCHLDFDWTDAAPLEKLTCAKCGYHLYGLSDARCPECGHPFDWNDALLDYRRKQKPLFEYRWREQPIRSLVRTWWRSLRPGKFWRSIDIHDPPQVRPLIAYSVIGGIALIVSFATCWLLFHWGNSVGAYFRSTGGLPSKENTLRLLSRWMTNLSSLAAWRAVLILYVAWSLAFIPALLIFQVSMHHYRIATRQVIRAWSYSLAPWASLICVTLYVVRVVYSYQPTSVYPVAFHIGPMITRLGIAASVIVLSTWSIYNAYKHYLRMPRSIAIALAAQVIAILSALVTLVFCGYPRFVSDLIVDAAKLVGLRIW